LVEAGDVNRRVFITAGWADDGLNVSQIPQSSSPILPSESVDDFATVLARRLQQPLPARAWGLFTTVLLGVCSFGILPLLIWPGRFRDYVAAESRAMQEIAEWARVRGKRPAAVGPLFAAAEDAACKPLPWLACLLLTLFVVVAFWLSFMHTSLTWDHLLGVTYYFPLRGTGIAQPHALHLHKVWVAVLSVGYLLHWLQVRSHASDVKLFVARLNPLVEAEHLPPIPTPRCGSGVGVMSIVAAVLMCLYGAWWGIPMLLAGAAQRRYMRVTGPTIRRELHLRISDIAAQRRMPRPVLQTAIPSGQQCSNRRCLAPLRIGAKFCTRCGSAKVNA
jgi:hypothetical protein